MIVRNILGEEREAHVYPNGSRDCPFCGAAVCFPETECGNPSCDAGTFATRERALDRIARREQQQREDEERTRRHEQAMERTRQYHEQQAAQYRDWHDAGYCVKCARSSNGQRLVRHRAGHEHLAA